MKTFEGTNWINYFFLQDRRMLYSCVTQKRKIEMATPGNITSVSNWTLACTFTLRVMWDLLLSHHTISGASLFNIDLKKALIVWPYSLKRCYLIIFKIQCEWIKSARSQCIFSLQMRAIHIQQHTEEYVFSANIVHTM